ncbi:gluconate kinase (SKI family) [Rhizobium sp. ERR 922]|uniref:gluconokinase n=1 Tax=unclassified Rhizobium TaxID=2613769 RepID=UPI0011A952E3|nr:MULTISPECIES: gluconokinase [unclassified Rhizobium]TWB46700.1 gluconate kinase (SKI family) [Rhizobium sp. ERR 922]TWB89185.1 gluconate kinase (SKI family) [Rhizobium sp. ERR 942]
MSTAASRLRSDGVLPRHFVIMGVSGCGKSSVGSALAARVGGIYVDGDDLHPAANVAKMSAGIPLTDADRWPWLDKIGQRLTLADEIALIGCSALKRIYRDRIREVVGAPVSFIHLAGTRETILKRMQARRDHFMPPALLASQFAALEPPGADEQAITVDIDQPLDQVVAAILIALEETQS